MLRDLSHPLACSCQELVMAAGIELMVLVVLSVILGAVSVFAFHHAWALFNDRIHLLLSLSLCLSDGGSWENQIVYMNSGLV